MYEEFLSKVSILGKERSLTSCAIFIISYLSTSIYIRRTECFTPNRVFGEMGASDSG